MVASSQISCAATSAAARNRGRGSKQNVAHGVEVPPMADAIRQIGVSEVTCYRWRQEFGGLKTEQVKRLKDLELENSRLRKAVSDLTLDKLILQEAARGNF